MKRKWLQNVATAIAMSITLAPLQVSTTFAQVNPSVVTTAPTVGSVTALNDHQVSVTFNTKMDAGTVPSGVTVYGEDLSTIDANVVADPSDLTGKRFIVSFPAVDNLYAKSITRKLNVAFSNSISDFNGNMLVATNKYVTLKRDTTIPAISSITTTKYDDGSVATLVMNLTKGSKAVGAGLFNASGIRIVDTKTGIEVTNQFSFTNDAVADGDKKITFSFADNPAKPFYGTYKFWLPAGLVTDNTQGAGNSSRTTMLNVNFGTYVNTFKITQDCVSANPTAHTIQVNFGRKVTNSAVVPSNYMIGGKALPSTTWISLDGTGQTATIYLPAGFATVDNTLSTFRVANVRDTSNTTLTTFTGTVSVYDNTAPVLKTVQVPDQNHILLTYSENMAQSFSGDVANEFIITNNGKYHGTVTAQAVNGYPKEVLLTLGTALDLRYSVILKTVAVSSGAQLVDGSLGANDQVGGTLLTATILH